MRKHGNMNGVTNLMKHPSQRPQLLRAQQVLRKMGRLLGRLVVPEPFGGAKVLAYVHTSKDVVAKKCESSLACQQKTRQAGHLLLVRTNFSGTYAPLASTC